VSYKDVPFVYSVWFTEITRAGIHSAIAWQDDQILSSEDVAGDIVEVLSNATRRLVSNLKMRMPTQIAPHSKLKNISQVLLPRFTAYQSPIERQKEVKNFLESALQEQLEMMKLVGSLKSVLLPGMAGTGKTHIALQAARQAHERGEKVLFLCFNNMLARHLGGLLVNYPLVRVSSLHLLLLEIAGN
jgi:primosomal protein N'